jgi:hypothetical protein
VLDPYTKDQTGVNTITVGSIYVEKVQRRVLSSILEEELAAEGFESLADFYADWWRRRGYTESDDDPRHRERLTADVWVIGFQAAVIERRWLLAAPAVQSDYTDRHDKAVWDEPEAIDPDVVRLLPATAVAQRKWERVQRERLRAAMELPLAEQARLVQQLADQGVIDEDDPAVREARRQMRRALRGALGRRAA